MLDDGEIERRVRLLRPMESHSIALNALAERHWVEADRERFAAAWQAELAEVLEFTESTIHRVAGLLLPIWKRLPNESTRVYRLQTDAGERIIGRWVSPAWVASAIATGAPTLTPGLQLRRARVMGANRIELSGFSDNARPAQGLWALPRDHHLEAAAVRAHGRDWRRCAGKSPAALSGRAHHRARGRVMPYDAAELAHRLARDAEAVCRRYLSKGRRQGRYWMVGDVRNTPGRSMFVRLKGPESGPGAAGHWTDAATGEHGDLLDVIRETCGLIDFRDVADEARRFPSLPHAAPRRPPNSVPAPAGSPEAARRLFAMSLPIRRTLVETYLRNRGITTLHDAGALRFHPRCYYRPDDDFPLETWPAMIACVTDLAGRITGGFQRRSSQVRHNGVRRAHAGSRTRTPDTTPKTVASV
jgi:hypothetical protein